MVKNAQKIKHAAMEILDDLGNAGSVSRESKLAFITFVLAKHFGDSGREQGSDCSLSGNQGDGARDGAAQAGKILLFLQQKVPVGVVLMEIEKSRPGASLTVAFRWHCEIRGEPWQAGERIGIHELSLQTVDPEVVADNMVRRWRMQMAGH